MAAIAECRVNVGVEGAGSCEGVTFDAWDLDEAADRVAGHAEMMFESHLAGVFNLCHAASEDLASRTSCHCASYTDLALTPHFGTRD